MTNISFPVEQMRSTAQSILNEVDNLQQSAAWYWNRLRSTSEMLSPLMAETAATYDQNVQPKLDGVVTDWENAAKQLVQDAQNAQTTDTTIGKGVAQP
jgi:hypothetical protein